MEKTFFISGIGGQGVQVLCKALAKVVDDCGMNMCLYPWYQGQRRGGATYGRLIISDERVGAPEKRSYDVVVLLDEASLRDYGDKRKATSPTTTSCTRASPPRRRPPATSGAST